jgi:DNA-binding NtrC family response regulator
VLGVNAGPGSAAMAQEAQGTGGARLDWFDFSDGAGRRLRLGVGGGLDETGRASLQVLVSNAALAFEVAALRGFRAVSARAPASPAAESGALPNLIAASPAMRRLKQELGRLSGSRGTIILTGQSGTGKEVVARAIHDLSRRAAGPYVTFNSAAVPRDLFEGQLFGYRKGAFTGAVADHPGVIRAAEGGTLFLDEVGELPLDVQPKLLRFLENAEVHALGERAPVQVDVRVIAATHRDLLQLVRDGKFREDLYYRLQVIPVHIPPLKERREDILALARFFLRTLLPAGQQPPLLTPDAEAKLVDYPWPGNVRELRNVIERALAFEPLPEVLSAEDLRLERGGRAGAGEERVGPRG